MLENGDLIFVKDLSDMGQAIQASTGYYSHVAIFLDGLIYMLVGEQVLSVKNQMIFLNQLISTISIPTQI